MPGEKEKFQERENLRSIDEKVTAVYGALLARREVWYRRYRPRKEIPTLTPQREKYYRRRAALLVAACAAPADFMREVETKYRPKTVHQWERDLDLAARLLQEKFAGEGVAISGGQALGGEEEEKVVPPSPPEPQIVEGEVREELVVSPSPPEVQIVGEGGEESTAAAAPVEEQPPVGVGERPKDWRSSISEGFKAAKERFKLRLREIKLPHPHIELPAWLSAIKSPLGRKEAKEVGKEIASAEVPLPGQELAKPSQPEIKFAFGREAWQRLQERWQRLDPTTRRRLAIYATIGVSLVGVGALVYVTHSRHPEVFRTIATHLSGITKGAGELLTEATPTATKTSAGVGAIPKATPTPGSGALSSPSAEAQVLARELREIAREVSKAVGEVPKVVGEVPRVSSPAIKEVTAAGGEVSSPAVDALRQVLLKGAEIVKGGHVWDASQRIAEAIMEASGVGKNSGVKTVITDAIKDLSPLRSRVVQPGEVVRVDPTQLASYLEKTGNHIKQVMGVGGELKVPLKEGDLETLAKVIEFLKNFKAS